MFNFCMVLVSILYTHNVVGGVVNYINDIYGARTHSARRYSRVHMHI